MNTKKIISVQNEIFSEVKNLWELSNKGNKSNIVLDTFLDELNMKKTPENRFIAYSRISDLRVEPLDLYLDKMSNQINENNENSNIKIPNKLENKREVLNKAYRYVKKIYEDSAEKFIYKLEKEKIVDSFELTIFKWVLNVWKAFNNFTPVWENMIIKQNEILDKKFDGNSEKIMKFLRDKNLLELDEKWNETDRSYSILKWWKAISYFEAFTSEINFIVVCLQDFIEELKVFENKEKSNYINYLTVIKEAFLETNINKLLSIWQKVDEAWMQIKWPLQIAHPLESYEDKYRKWVAPEWDLRVLDTQTLNSKVEKNIELMYEKIYDELWRDKYNESYNFSKENFSRVQLYISEPVMYFGAELNWLFSAQVVPNDEEISEKFWKKIFAYPKMVLESKKKAPIMKLTKDILGENLLNDYLKILRYDSLYFDIYDIETIGHEFWHTLWLTKDSEVIMNKKTWNFKNIEEFKATTWGLCSYFYENRKDINFDSNIIIMHLVRCIWLLKYREVAEVLPYYNESLIHLDIMFETGIFEIKNSKIILNFTEKNWEKLKTNYLKHYKRLINIYLEKLDAWEFLFKYVITDKSWNNISKNKILQEFGNYYYDLYKKIWNEVV
jgi:hypothetical protein